MRKLTIAGAVVLVLAVMGWGAVYASASSWLKLYPVVDGVVAEARPRISVSWPRVPGVKLRALKVTLDGRVIEPAPPVTASGFGFRPEADLAEGEHEVRVEATYDLGATKDIDTTWRFTVDTEPPPLGLENGEPFFVSPSREAVLPLKTERGARVEAVFNDKNVEVDPPGRDGRFKLSLTGFKANNRLRLTAADAIGNQRAVSIPVILDETTPVIESIMPAEGEVVRQPSAKLEVTFREEESGLRSVILSLDGTEAVTGGGDGAKSIAYLGPLMTDGPHAAKVEAVDYAGRKASKEWRFTVDTRRIVVSRAARRLYFYQNGVLQRTYPVAVGMPGYETPGGRWEIINKQINPSWYNPGSSWALDMPKVVPPGWSNPLGVRALALSARNILIHGTSDYASMGRAASHGCVRMRNVDIVNFFPEVDVGVPVDIL